MSAPTSGFGPDALSPDGHTVAFAKRPGGELFVRRLDELEATPLRGAEDTTQVVFSPYSQWLLVSDGDSYLKVPLDGGPAIRVTDDLSGGADWGPDDTIVVGSRTGGLWIGTAAGGDLRPLIEPEGVTNYLLPKLLPNGRAVLFHTYTPNSDVGHQVGLYDLETGRHWILLDGSSPQYATSGHLVYSGRDALWAVPFDADRLEVTGEPRAVLGGFPPGAVGVTPYSLARDGTLVYRHPDSESNRTLVWVDRQRRQEPVAMAPGFYAGLRLSPDGRQVVVEDVPSRNLLIHNLERNTTTPFITEERWYLWPVWAGDGRQLVYGSHIGPIWELFLKNADGTGIEKRLTRSPAALGIGSQGPTSITPDEEAIVFGATRRNSVGDVGVLSWKDDAEVQWLLDEAYSERFAEVSPDGRWIAYQSDESGRPEVYVRSFPDTDRVKRAISTEGGTTPAWGPGGKELFYRGPGGEMMVVSVETEPTFSAGTPTLLFKAREFLVTGGSTGGRAFDIDAKGDRFLMVKTDSEALVVQNWTEELKRLVPIP